MAEHNDDNPVRLDGPVRVAVLGASGRMGAEAVAAVRGAADMELVAQLGSTDPLEQITEAGATHIVDLTVPTATEANVHFAVEHGIHAVVGTTGWDGERLAALEQKLAQHKKPAQHKKLSQHTGVGVLIAPNFALGAVLASAFAAKAAQYFESAEIIELHHPNKVDAPSGTAVRTAELMAQSRAEAGVGPSPDATQTQLDGARGATVEDIHVHSVRLRGLVAHQEVLLGSTGEQLSIRHDSFDRASFMPGVLLGLRTAASRPGLTHGLDGYLDLGL